jgi:hypothetical protein
VLSVLAPDGEETELLYIVDPALSGIDQDSGTSFLNGMLPKLVHHENKILRLDSELRIRPSIDDAVVVFNPSGSKAFRPSVKTLLESALAGKALVLPVALNEHDQLPPEPLIDRRAFPSHDVLLRYDLPRSQLKTAGDEFARTLLAELWPTCSRQDLKLFLSYRRSDGEKIVRELGAALSVLQQQPIRDLAAFRTGRAIRREILQKLADCDVLIFIDTPKAPTSDWVRWELALAMGTGVPIVWVQIGQRSNRDDLPVWPSEGPDMVVSESPSDAESIRRLAIDIRERAFHTALAHVRRACATLARIRALKEVNVVAVDSRAQIYCVIKPKFYRGQPSGSEREVIQVFGRRPSLDDRRKLGDWLRTEPEGFADLISKVDYAFLLSSSPMAPDDRERVIVTHGITYVEERSAPQPQGIKPSTNGPELLLLGAYSRGEGSAQEVREAVHEIATTWLSRDGHIRFGGHPSITPLINIAAETVVPGHESEHVTIYQSRFFPKTSAGLAEIAAVATVVATEAVGDRDASLTVMRERMIGDGNIVAAVVVGGRTEEQGLHRPGVQEEFDLAVANGIPVYLLGRPGGHTTVLVNRARAEDPPWASLNNLMSADENEELATTDDYWSVARRMWDRHV